VKHEPRAQKNYDYLGQPHPPGPYSRLQGTDGYSMLATLGGCTRQGSSVLPYGTRTYVERHHRRPPIWPSTGPDLRDWGSPGTRVRTPAGDPGTVELVRNDDMHAVCREPPAHEAIPCMSDNLSHPAPITAQLSMTTSPCCSLTSPPPALSISSPGAPALHQARSTETRPTAYGSSPPSARGQPPWNSIDSRCHRLFETNSACVSV
jgi:hypothetical protein